MEPERCPACGTERPPPYPEGTYSRLQAAVVLERAMRTPPAAYGTAEWAALELLLYERRHGAPADYEARQTHALSSATEAD